MFPNLLVGTELRARRQVMKGADWQRGLTITFPLHPLIEWPAVELSLLALHSLTSYSSASHLLPRYLSIFWVLLGYPGLHRSLHILQLLLVDTMASYNLHILDARPGP